MKSLELVFNLEVAALISTPGFFNLDTIPVVLILTFSGLLTETGFFLGFLKNRENHVINIK